MEAKALEHERLLLLATADAALRHAIAAAEMYMQAMAKAKTATERSKLGRKANDLLALAERLKANARMAAASSRLPVPESTRLLPAGEKAIILRSSKLHGNIFPPWESEPSPDTFTKAGTDGETVFTDASEFSLSAEQKAIFAGWKRPMELFQLDADEIRDPVKAADRFMHARKESDLAQDLATDCSVVASLCSVIKHLGPNQSSLLPSWMYPFNDEAKRPELSKNGKYIFRMNFNGSWRQVVIDDRLPSSSTDRTLFVVDKRNPQLIWPALWEKAYLKIRGGYNFPGSNSGTDLYALTGWIPEQIFLKDDDIEPRETWDRIKKAFDQGDVLVTLGTGNISPEEEATLGLVKEHDYAVLDMKVESDNRLLLVKNPWVDSLVWTGVGSSATVSAHTPGSSSNRTGKDHLTNTFWMTFEDVMQHFDSLYLNWNPALFTHSQDHHFSWEIPEKTAELVFTHNPQYSVRSSTGSPVWILLSRHWQDGELDILRDRKQMTAEDTHESRGTPIPNQSQSDSLANVSKQLGFMCLALFDTTPPGTRVPLAEGHRRLVQGPYVDSPNTLLRFTPTPNKAYTLVIGQGGLPLPKYSFTLSFFSTSPLTISPAVDALPHNTTVQGSWTRRTAGGSAATWSSNPRFALTIPQRTPLSLLLSTDASDLPVHIAVLYSGSSSSSNSTSSATATTSRGRRDIIAASLEYRRGANSAQSPGPIEPGTYTVVVSTFEPGQLARFNLRVAAAAGPLSLRPELPDNAGRLRTPAPGGPAVFGDGEARLRARVVVSRLTRLGIVARTERIAGLTTAPASTSGSSSPAPGGASRNQTGLAAPFSAMALSRTNSAPCAIRVSLELGTGPNRTVVAVSHGGEFEDATLGLRTPEVDVAPETVGGGGGGLGGVWVVVEQIGSQRWVGQGVVVEVLSDAAVGIWGWERDE